MQPSHRANRLVKILGSWTAAADNTCARQIASFNGNNASTGNRTNKGVSSDPTNNNSRDNSSSINISSGSRDNSTSINIGSSRDNNSTSTNRQLFISTNSRYRHHTNSRPTADSRSTRRPQKRQHHCRFLLQLRIVQTFTWTSRQQITMGSKVRTSKQHDIEQHDKRRSAR
ncbi:unnamed protein product [Closterium sp. NIES-53]